eukprot:719018-Rhodomonas_salina.2
MLSKLIVCEASTRSLLAECRLDRIAPAATQSLHQRPATSTSNQADVERAAVRVWLRKRNGAEMVSPTP